MEIVLTFVLAGIAILLNTMRMIKRMHNYLQIQNTIESSFDVSMIDVSGQTEYVRCFSHQWALDNIVRQKPGWLGTKIYEYLRDNTFSASICILLILGVTVILSGLVIVHSINILGEALVVLLFSGVILIGPEESRSAEEYLRVVRRIKTSVLNAEDYAYVKLAIASIKRWIYRSAAIGVLLIITAPNAYSLMSSVAMLISIVTSLIIIQPALILLEFHFVATILYVMVMVVLVFYMIPKEINRILKRGKSTEKEEERTIII